jgi:hypothetical protein
MGGEAQSELLLGDQSSVTSCWEMNPVPRTDKRRTAPRRHTNIDMGTTQAKIIRAHSGWLCLQRLPIAGFKLLQPFMLTL